MTNIETNPETATATETATVIDTLEAPVADAPHQKGKKKNKAKRRVAKALAWFALVFTALLVLAEPWLLIPVAALIVAVSLWD